MSADQKLGTNQIELVSPGVGEDRDAKRRNSLEEIEKTEHVHERHIVAQESHLSLWQACRRYPRASMFSALAAFSAVSDGFQYNLPGNILALPGFIQQFGYPDPSAATGYRVNPTHISIWGIVYTLAYIFSLYVGTYPSDRYGRRPMILAIHLLCVCSILTEMFATDWTHWLAAKLINGLSVGINQSALTTYVSEIAPTPARGALLANYPIWWALGSFLANVTLNIMSRLPASQWRNAVYSQWAFTAVGIAVWFILPESPRWLCRKSRHDDAMKSLKYINGQVKGYDLEHEYGVIQQELADGEALSKMAKNINFFTIFRGTNLRRTFISFLPFAWQQWTGNPVISQYTAYFFQLAGMKEPFIGSLAVSIIKIVSALISPIITETAGRRRLLLIGGCVMVVCMFAISGVLRIPNLGANAGAGIGLITICCVWMASYCLTLNSIGYVYLGETSTLLLRAKTTGFAAGSTGWLNLFHNGGLPVMLNAPGFGPSGTCFVYSATCLGGLILTYFFVPETKGRSFIELDELFERRIPARQFRLTETEVDRAKKEERERGRV